MTRKRSDLAAVVLGLGTALVAVPGCDDPGTLRAIHVDSTVVRSSSVQPDPGRTWEYDPAGAPPDSVLATLWQLGFPLEVAWRPIAYRCDDPRGPRLTVQLARQDERMADHDFVQGTGRLACSEELMRYVVSWVEG